MINIAGPCAATSKMACFGPSGAKTAFLPSPFWRNVFSGFSETGVILKSPFFQNRGETAKNTKCSMPLA